MYNVEYMEYIYMHVCLYSILYNMNNYHIMFMILLYLNARYTIVTNKSNKSNNKLYSLLSLHNIDTFKNVDLKYYTGCQNGKKQE